MSSLKTANISEVEATEYEDIMTIIGFGKVHWWMLLTCGLLLMEVFSETMGMAIIAPASKCDFDANEGERAVLYSAAFIGIVCSSLFWGYICDFKGRHRMLLFSVGISNCCSLISTFMPSLVSFTLMRFLMGIFIAVPSFVTLTYISEFCTQKHRQVVLNYMFMFNGFAMMYLPGLAAPILGSDWELQLVGGLKHYSWNLLAQLYILPGVLGFLLLIKLPESPKFLLSVGKDESAFAVLDWLCRANTGKNLNSFEVYRVKTLPFHRDDLDAVNRSSSLDPCKLVRLMWKDASPLFHKPFVHRLILSCFIMFGIFMIANGLGIWFTDMRNHNDLFYDDPYESEVIITRTICNARMKEDFSNSDIVIALHEFVCNDTFLTFRDSLILGATIILIYLVLGVLLLVLPRKVIFIVPLLLSGACGISLTWLRNPEAILAMHILFLALPGAVVNLLGGAIVEFVPTTMRGQAVGICMMAGRIGVICGSTFIGHFLDHYCEFILNFFALFLLLCGFLGYWLPL